ncbi:formate dehydrogenase subunit delta [Ancylobacter terrae]|uniref:formate dehydrogenase subunit delta n=1 Tax=Ancylobacter sp. sgz301288 TaxID=3342077 RepID=UPI00385816E9
MSHDPHATMNKLVYMANQIGKFFVSQPRGHAMPGIAKHIRDFWDPRMRAQMEDHIAEGGAGLDPIVLEALKTLPPVSRADIPVAHPTLEHH